MHATNPTRFLSRKVTTDTDFQEHIGREFLIIEDKVDNDDDVDADDSGYFSDGKLSTTDLEEVDDDEFFWELETNDILEVVKHYKTPVKPLALPLLDVGSIIQTPTNADVKEATDIHDDVGAINIEWHRQWNMMTGVLLLLQQL